MKDARRKAGGTWRCVARRREVWATYDATLKRREAHRRFEATPSRRLYKQLHDLARIRY